MLTISDIFHVITLSAEWIGLNDPPTVKLNGVSTDSRSIGKNEVFVAIVGERFDGHQFMQKAFDNGAIAAIVSRDWCTRNQQDYSQHNFIVVEDTLYAYQEIAKYYLSKFKIPRIAVTGSSGKTTAKETIYSVLSQRFRVLRNKKSFNNHIGVPATLFELRPHHELLLIELGTNHFGELERLSYLVEPDICLLLNIGYAHLEFFKNVNGVLKAKMEIFSHANVKGTAIYNHDDPILAKQSFPVSRSLSYGIKKGAHIGCNVLKCDALARYKIRFQDADIQLQIPGHHNISNALSAIAVASEFGLTTSEIKKGLEGLSHIDQRMEIVEVGGLKIFNDSYNSNPGSSVASLSTLADMQAKKGGRKIVILGDMLELGEFSEIEHAKLAEHVSKYKLDALFLYGEETYSTFKRALQLKIPMVKHFKDRDMLHQAVVDFVSENDIVLIKGSRGMRLETVVNALKNINKDSI